MVPSSNYLFNKWIPGIFDLSLGSMKNGSRYLLKDPPRLRLSYIVSISKVFVIGFLSKAIYFDVD
jgi:hypothetical protein